MTGAARDTIPADERFYAGGGGSIRGYAFQSVGPLEGTEPLGGRSLLEVSVEFRLKLSDRIGLVTFIDGGNVFTGSTPDLGEDLQWGAGLGLRYFTAIGPVRLDISVPLNRREGIDDRFQIYVSLGQAF
ncbi:MAG: BamA/TamA family outer membrane protein [Desulfobacterales bacterium]|nr:BamA/TamA family outer membrane protein [Desulfobacterales bacterium]